MAAGRAAYLDTSFVAPYYLAEATSRSVETFIKNAQSGSLALSSWTTVEFASLLARKQRMTELTADLALEIKGRFDQDVSYRYDVLTPQNADYILAEQRVLRDPGLGLRGPDGLQLAVAATNSLTLYTLDKTLLTAAQALGVSASNAGIGTP